MAWRSEPTPLSSMLVTVIVALLAGVLHGKAANVSIKNNTTPTRMLLRFDMTYPLNDSGCYR